MDQYEVSFEVTVVIDADSDNEAIENAIEALGSNTAEYVSEDDAVKVETTKDREDNIILGMAEKMVAEQRFNPDVMELSDIIGGDECGEVQHFITCSIKAEKKFDTEHIFSVINGSYPYVDGVDVVGLYDTTIELAITHTYKTWNMDSATDKSCVFPPMKKEEAFIKYFKEYNLRYSYCNDDSHSITDKELHTEFHKWLDIGNYARYGGRMD